MDQKDYLCYTTNNEKISRPIDKTVYHLRKRAINEKVSKRELLLCLYNILHARGHFLMETIRFADKNRITFDDFKEKVYSTIDGYIDIPNESKQSFEKEILSPIFSNNFLSKEITSLCNNAELILDEKEKLKLIEFLKLIRGYSSNTTKIDEDLKNEKCNINDLKSSDEELSDFFVNSVELYDLIKVSQIMKNHDYLCEVAIEKIDEFDEKVKDKNSRDFKEYNDKLKGQQKSSAKHLRTVRNLENSFPNGLYVKEARAILKNQQQYYPEITQDFIEVCESIVAARIPYYMGPQPKNIKDSQVAWSEKTGAFKYSYKYSMEQGKPPVDKYKSIETWKNRMRSHCTYLPDEYALPKGSFVAETFSILNELNILSAVDENENTYYLTYNDKVKIIDELFLNGKEVKYSDVADLLNLKSFGSRNQSNTNRKFNNKYTLYPSISNRIPELKLNSVSDVLSENENVKRKIEKIEEIILEINLYNEEKSKVDYFIKECHYSDEVAKALGKLKSNSFYSFSRKFILEQKMNQDGNSLMSLLFEDNTKKYTNEQMTLINNAVDKNGNHLDFSANKYEKILESNGGNLGIDLLINEGTPLIPISRPVIRGLNEAMKVYAALIDTYGVPKRVIIETARDLKDHSIVKTQPAKHSNEIKSLYTYLEKQVKDHNKDSKYKWKVETDDWENIEKYLESNKIEIELYIRQNGIDLLTGDTIKLNQLENYEVDHILPRGYGDDSLDDKILISKLANSRKGNRLPLEFINCHELIGDRPTVLTSEFIKKVEELYDMKLISEKKRERLLMESSDELEGFINRNLVDTRYIIREFMSILNAYNKYHNYNTHIVSLRAAYTSLYRRTFWFDKVRDYGEQHHAHDAALLIVADKTLSTYYPNYDEREHRDGPTKGKIYSEFIQEMISNRKSGINTLDYFIKGMFAKAYGLQWNNPSSIITQIKNFVPFYSTKVEKNYKGKFFNAKILGQEKYKDTDVLSIVGVNNDKHVFSSVECVAVDFYKVTDKKRKKKHIAIHIPKVIVDRNGVIDKDKYIALVKKHYNAEELLDENGELITGYFRFRAYKNDIIYNTVANCPMLFNIGSIALRKLELKYINVFSYNDIYAMGNEIRAKLIKEYNLKTKANPNGTPFKDIDTKVYVDYVNQNYWYIPNSEKRINTVYELVKNDKSIYELSNHLSFLGLIINRPGTPPTIVGQYKPAIQDKLVSKDDDAQYIKLKYNILGLRFIPNPDGKLIVVSPKEIPGAFKQIKKEKFTWQLSNDELK